MFKPGFVLVKSEDFNQQHKSENPEAKKLQKMFDEVKNIYFPDINKSSFLI